jgi:hypothetical protein
MTSKHTWKSVKQACIVNPFFFGWLYLLKNKNDKVKCFSRFSIVRIWPKFKKNCQIFLFTWFKWVARNIERCFTILLSHLACSQIWLHLPLDHCHFGSITKLTKNTVLWWKAFSNLAKFSKLAKNIQIGQKTSFLGFLVTNFHSLKNIYIADFSAGF